MAGLGFFDTDMPINATKDLNHFSSICLQINILLLLGTGWLKAFFEVSVSNTF